MVSPVRLNWLVDQLVHVSNLVVGESGKFRRRGRRKEKKQKTWKKREDDEEDEVGKYERRRSQ